MWILLDFMRRYKPIWRRNYVRFSRVRGEGNVFVVWSLNGMKYFLGGFEEYTEQIEELNILCEEKLVAASLHRDHHISQLEKEYEAELERAQIEYVKEKESLKERMIVQIEEKKKKLREDKDLLEITNDIAIESSARVHNTRKHRKKDANHHDGRPSSKRRHMTADVMILQLKDQDISQDIALIQKGHGQQLSECSDEETNTSTSNHHCNGSSHKKSTKHRR
ncbi:hypothetical protein K7432_009799 [Basidiobolus ranarum]|uniref:Uncharacterized protein n=1 Tax=Basidiobolus ranarum TaxID=34480 RepID=A0ABR2WPV9_9FUNG